MIPDFIGIGVQKAGTTWLDRNLEAHPEVWMPPRKEIHYFNRPLDAKDKPNKKTRTEQENDYRKYSLSSLKERMWLRRFRRSPRSDEWYLSLFTPGKGQISGEITPDYSTLDRANIARVYDLAPGAKIIFAMRNPIERTWSHALMDFKRSGRDAEKSSVVDLLEFARRDHVIRRADYLATLEAWSEFFAPERIFVGFMEDIEDNPRPFLRSVYEFLEVDPAFKPPTPKKRINVRSTGSMPADVARAYAQLYRDDLTRLSAEFGGHTSFWLHCAEELISEKSQSQPEERVTVPMSKSEFRQSWDGTGEFMSRTLSELSASPESST